jgi:sugar (pentulose or hexulose) kinase
MALYVGIDFGTSGCRATAINQNKEVVADFSVQSPLPLMPHPSWSEQDAEIWWDKLVETLSGLLSRIEAKDVCAIAIDGTSSTLLVCDSLGDPLAPALMYNDTRCSNESELIAQFISPHSGAHGPGSSLAKTLYLQARYPDAHYALHQSDWLMGRLSAEFGMSDENNALKMGYSPANHAWPDWIEGLNIKAALLPKVYPPGTAVATIDPQLAKQFGLSNNTRLVTGTTDSTAAFIATGAQHIGEAVTSLGSTLVTKIIASIPIYSSQHGIYSHKLFNRWLTGGASNSGGAALLQFFTVGEMIELTPLLYPENDTGLDYYPLPATGERFPIADPTFKPRLPTSIPTDKPSRAVIFQGLLEGISKIESHAYQLLNELGAPYPDTVLSVGGGAVNQAWTQIRQRYLGVPVIRAKHHEASYGSALLARLGVLASKNT